jgi:hypothetical protein
MQRVFGLTSLMVILIWGCNETPQSSLFNPETYDESYKDIPVISQIAPAESSLAGVGTVTISGVYFTPEQPYNVNNQVVFGNVIATILDMSETEITVTTPLIVGDTIPVKVWSKGAEPFSDPFNYRLKPSVQLFGAIQDQDFFGGIAADPQENVYLSIQGQFENGIYKVAPDGQTSRVAQTTYLRNPGLVYGPNNALYGAVSSGRINKVVKFDLASGTESDVANVSPTIPKDLDFDNNQNLWVTARQTAKDPFPCDIIKVTLDGSKTTMATYEVFLQTVRVVTSGSGTYLYTGGYDESIVNQKAVINVQKIWRNEILGDGTLGAAEEVLDMLAQPLLANLHLRMITFSESGIMYIATDGSPDAVFTLNMDSGEVAVWYPGLISPEIYDFVWGNGPFLYACRNISGETSQLLKIDMDQAGAFYAGRD